MLFDDVSGTIVVVVSALGMGVALLWGTIANAPELPEPPAPARLETSSLKREAEALLLDVRRMHPDVETRHPAAPVLLIEAAPDGPPYQDVQGPYPALLVHPADR